MTNLDEKLTDDEMRETIGETDGVSMSMNSVCWSILFSFFCCFQFIACLNAAFI